MMEIKSELQFQISLVIDGMPFNISLLAKDQTEAKQKAVVFIEKVIVAIKTNE